MSLSRENYILCQTVFHNHLRHQLSIQKKNVYSIKEIPKIILNDCYLTHNTILIYLRRIIYLPTLDLHTIRIRNNHPVPTKRSRFPHEIFIISGINWTYMFFLYLKKFIEVHHTLFTNHNIQWILRISLLKYELS